MVRLPPYKSCFGCGRLNPIGLKLEIYWDRSRKEIFCEFNLPEEYQGFEGVIHGGIVSTICDEVLWWAVTSCLKRCSVTAEMRIKYRRPIAPNTTYRATARVVEAKGKKIRATCRIEREDKIYAEAEGLFVALPEEEWEKFLSEIDNPHIFEETGECP